MGKDKQQIKKEMDSIATVHDLSEWVIKHGPFVGIVIDNDCIYAYFAHGDDDFERGLHATPLEFLIALLEKLGVEADSV